MGSRGARCEIAVETSKNMECTSVLVGAGTQGLGKAYQDMKEPKPQTSQSWPEVLELMATTLRVSVIGQL